MFDANWRGPQVLLIDITAQVFQRPVWSTPNGKFTDRIKPTEAAERLRKKARAYTAESSVFKTLTTTGS